MAQWRFDCVPGYFEIEARHARHLARLGEQPHSADVQVAQDLRADAVVAQVELRRDRRLLVQRAVAQLAQTDDYDALVALGAVIRGETYHFEIVANESASGISSVALEFGIPIGNGILTCETDAQATERMDRKGFEAAQAALEMANLLLKIEDD